MGYRERKEAGCRLGAMFQNVGTNLEAYVKARVSSRRGATCDRSTAGARSSIPPLALRRRVGTAAGPLPGLAQSSLHLPCPSSRVTRSTSIRLTDVAREHLCPPGLYKDADVVVWAAVQVEFRVFRGVRGRPRGSGSPPLATGTAEPDAVRDRSSHRWRATRSRVWRQRCSASSPL